jgi:hypothetical protein
MVVPLVVTWTLALLPSGGSVNRGGASDDFIDLTGWSFCALQDSVARHQALIDRIAPAARNIHAYWLARRTRRKKERQLNKAPATIHARAALARSSSAATGRRTSRCIKWGGPKSALLRAVSNSGASASLQRPPSFRLHQFC